MAVAALARSGLAILIVGLLLHTIGLATSHWTVVHDGSSTITNGLWQDCDPAICVGWSKKMTVNWAIIAFAIIGMLAGSAAAVAAGLCVFLPTRGLGLKPPTHIISIVAALFAAGCVGLCAICWVFSVQDNLTKLIDTIETYKLGFGYSFYLSIIGGTLFLIGGPIVYAGGRLHAAKTSEKSYLF